MADSETKLFPNSDKPIVNCLACGKPLHGRSDKKFCDSYCRNGYNNQHKREDEKYIQQVNSVIRRNRRILKTLCPQGKAIVRKELLDSLGYRYGVFSGIYRSAGTTYYLCYDYGFAVSYDRNIPKAVIIQQQEYMKDFDPWQYGKK
jgi:predicted nucleic acid-binding Zn ribbon protein